VPGEDLAALIRVPDYVSERASHLAWLMPPPLPEAVVRALCEAAASRGERAEQALLGLRNAEPSALVRQAIEGAVASDQPGVRAAALETFAAQWGTDARATWREFLASRSVPMRWAAESVLGAHGTEEDLPDAAAHLGRLIRARSSVEMSPPRGIEIVELLVRYRDHPVARAALDDLSARWDRLDSALRGWLEEHHFWLDPAGRADPPIEATAGPEETLVWPPPAVERDGDTLMLSFNEGAAHSDARDRFATLAAEHPLVEVLDGDREWLSLRVKALDPDEVIRQLWDSASSAG
jgi:hypothetical protein